ncbi:MAG: ElyC/SanA/YdcF family protein, partial [Waddliaceae bacterium]
YRFALACGFGSMTVVTSKYHTIRAKWIFKRVSRGRIHIRVRGARYDNYNPSLWWMDRDSVPHVMHEYAGLIYFGLSSLFLPPRVEIPKGKIDCGRS